MVICLERGADLHMAQLMPLHSLALAPVKSRLVLLFWYRLTQVVLEKRPLNGSSSSSICCIEHKMSFPPVCADDLFDVTV